MDFELIRIILTTLIPVSILVILVWTGNWKILLAISILTASSGFLGMNTYMTLDVAGIPESSLSGMLELTIVKFLEAIFILLLAVFTWLRKESISIKS
jgi:hypothetical protein